MMYTKSPRTFAIAAALLICSGARAQVQLTVSDDFTQASAQNNWATFDGACLTAGDGTGTIPKCDGLGYYKGQTLVGGTSGTLPDLAGAGALRLTNGFTAGKSGFMYGYNQAGGIISNFTFAAGTGVQILFKTMTYRGNSGGNGGGQGVDEADGADGISFFLIDAATNGVNGGKPYDMGAFGGSLGYTCSNSNNDPTLRADGTPRQYDGLLSGYMGLGIDEFGNFLNPSDNTASGPGLQAGRIGLRGAGSISWKALNANYSQYYPSSLTLGQQAEAVNNTCKTGTLWDYSQSTTGTTKSKQLTTTVADYADLKAYQILPASTQIANEAAVTRGDATPIAYQLKITQDGLLSLSYSYNGGAYLPVITAQDIKASNGIPPNLLRFGFAGSTGGSTNVHEILCFQANPTQLADTSVGVNQKEATQIGSGTQAFLALYFPNGWWGRLTASNILYDPTTQVVSVSQTANWDASCVLTGLAQAPTCPTTGAPNVNAETPGSRTILTWNGNQGVPFRWTQLSDPERAALDPGVSSTGTANRLNYLRGERGNEIDSSGNGKYRARISVLGDIVDASPAWVGPPNNPYTIVWKDRLYPNLPPPENGTATYAQFIKDKQTRQNVVYVGSNDGFLHGFRAGGFDVNGKFTTTNTPIDTPNDGLEVLAYIPGAVVSIIHNNDVPSVDYSNTRYGHVFYVDAPPATDDLYYGSAWHTWLVGGLGPGGQAIYMLDVTDPTQFMESKAASLVIGEWTPSSISCAGTNGGNCGNNLGNTYGVPVIRRLHNGTWGVIFGNGYGSTTGDAGIFIMTVDPVSAAKTFYYLSAGQAGKNDGIASPAPADYDGDHITDYVYAGDLLGNVWRFDLTSSDPTKWGVTSTGGTPTGGTPTPLFTEPTGEAITTKVTVGSGPVQGLPRAMIDFGTGRKIPLTNASAATYSAGVHRLYGIWDWNMVSWNSKSTARLDSMTSGPSTIPLANLQVQTLTVNGNGDLDGTNNPVCWADQTNCSTPKYGWYITLLNPLEQVIFNPIIFQDILLVNTTVPAANSPYSCKNTHDTGYTIAISLATGGSIPGLFPLYLNDTLAAGSLTNGSGSPFILQAGGQFYMLTQTLGGGTATGPIVCAPGSLVCEARIKPQGPVGKRLTWTQRR
jgi:type IV pilus assembly protein PilY1